MTSHDGKQKRINFQPYITQVSVDGGTQPGSMSGNLSLAIPLHHHDAVIRDANFVLRPGLEVHIYMRGYFPTRGLFRDSPEYQENLEGPQVEEQLPDSGQQVPGKTGALHSFRAQMGLPEEYNNRGNANAIKREQIDEWLQFKDQIKEAYSRERLQAIAQAAAEKTGVPFEYIWATLDRESGGKFFVGPSVVSGKGSKYRGMTDDNWDTGLGISQMQIGPYESAQKYMKKQGQDAWWPHSDLIDPKLSIWTAAYHLKQQRDRLGKKQSAEDIGAYWAGKSDYADYQKRVKNVDGALAKAKAEGAKKERIEELEAQKAKLDRVQALINTTKAKVEAAKKQNKPAQGQPGDDRFPPKNEGISKQQQQALVTQHPLDVREKSPLDDIIAYPYYMVFHGVVTNADVSYSGGFQTASLALASMLHFWQFHQLGLNASFFGSRPNNSKLQSSLVGRIFTGKHPYEIIYTLFHDTAGQAGGVGFALAQKTNQTAQIGGESLFSLNIRYWQKRFSNGRMMRLRLYGVNGMLFNSAQSAFLGRLSTSELSQVLRAKFNSVGSAQGTPALTTAAKLFGVGNQKIRQGTEEQDIPVSIQSTNSAKDALEWGQEYAKGPYLSLQDMIPFVSDLQQIGQANLWETTYESKLDAANKVCEVTGFEFFQDVDGDIVFKPPFYNLDTSQSRIYTLKDIDIISLNQTEREPQYTYVKGTGSWFKNFANVGPEGEFGVAGTYIDFRLVAQYGWKPLSFEASYYTDPRAIFYASINKLDIQNAESTTASAQIPLRPEIRCGYPFYIEFSDCYYYCNSFQHSWSAGGQCTTSLQLIGKRSKFYAPGDPNKSGIEKIDLSNTLLPPTPIEVRDKEGYNRLSGFPDVVMALDPEGINPLFFLAGDNIADLSNPQVLANLIRVASAQSPPVVEREPYTAETEDPQDTTGIYRMKVSETEDRRFVIGESPAAGVISLQAAAKEYQKIQTDFLKKVESSDKTISKSYDKQISAKQTEIAKLKGQKNANDEAVQQKIAAKYAEMQNILRQKEKAFTSPEDLQARLDQKVSKSSDAQIVLLLLRSVGDRYLKQDAHKIWGDLNTSQNLLELLSEKKATFTTGSTPGFYRYFSSAHPDAKQQGAAYSFSSNGVATNASAFTPGLRAKGFKPSSKIVKQDPLEVLPEAELANQENFCKKGLPIMVPSADVELPMPGGESKKAVRIGGKGGTFMLPLPTYAIQSLSFAATEVVTKRSKGSYTIDKITTESFKDPLVQAFLLIVKRRTTVADYTTAFAAFLDTTLSILADVVDDINQQTKKYVSFPIPAVDAKTTEQFSKADQVKLDTVLTIETANRIVENICYWYAAQIQSLYEQTIQKLRKQKKVQDAEKLAQINALKDIMSKTITAICCEDAGMPQAPFKPQPAKFLRKVTGKQASTVVHSPVFPVSDHNGYRVTGTYRYGRGIQMAPDSILDQIAALDPLSVLTPATMQRVSDAILMGKPTYETTTTSKNGKVIHTKKEVSKEGVLQQVARELEQAGFSKQFLIDRSALNQDGTVNENGFANFIADSKDSTQKVPSANIAYSLADLNFHNQLPEVSSTRGAEADVLLQAFSQNFVEVVKSQDYGNIKAYADTYAALPKDQEGNPTVDVVSQEQALRMGQKAFDWKLRQDILRGTVSNNLSSGRVVSEQIDRIRDLFKR